MQNIYICFVYISDKKCMNKSYLLIFIDHIFFIDINIGLEVLNSALILMRQLSPLSLGSKAELPQLGLDCLDNIMHFVKECLNADFIQNINGKMYLFF